MQSLQLHPLFTMYDLKEEDINSLAHLYETGIEIKRPYYNDGFRHIELEVCFKNDHNNSIKLFDRIFIKHGLIISCGLTRRFVFVEESGYYAFTNDLSCLMLLGYYSHEHQIHRASKDKGRLF
jgi:hypothetical protein